MIIYNVTSKVAGPVHAQWLGWMEETYLPKVMADSAATGYQLTRLLDVDDREGPTYALLLSFANRPALVAYRSRILPGHEEFIRETWGESVLCFGTTLDVVLSQNS